AGSEGLRQLVALATLVRAVDPFSINLEEHLRVRVAQLPRDPRRIGALHQCRCGERVPRLILLAISEAETPQTTGPGFPLALNVGPRRLGCRIPEYLPPNQLGDGALYLERRPRAFRELDVAHQVGLGRRLRLPAHSGRCNAHVALLEVEVVPAQGDLLGGPEVSKERGGEVICDLRALA